MTTQEIVIWARACSCMQSVTKCFR